MVSSIDINGTTYAVSLDTVTDEGGNQTQVLQLTNGDEVHRLSPNTTDEELAMYADPNNASYTL